MRSRQRTHFTDYQTRILEERFTNCHYPNSDMKKELAAELGLLENRITVWFQNRRAKKRRHMKKENESSHHFFNGVSSSLNMLLAPLSLPHANKTEVASDAENSFNFSWYQNGQETNEWKLPAIYNHNEPQDTNFYDVKNKSNKMCSSFKPNSSFNDFNSYGGQSSSQSSNAHATWNYYDNSILFNDSTAGESSSKNSPNFTPYSVAQQSYIHPNFVNVSAMSSAFNMDSTVQHYPFYPQN